MPPKKSEIKAGPAGKSSSKSSSKSSGPAASPINPPVALSGPPSEPAHNVTPFQKFTIRRVHRSEINPAPYNPRAIDPYAFRKLKANLKAGKIGLLEPLIWNERTGNLVGGHQRLRALDELNGSTDYHLDVSCVSLDPVTEQEQNIALNNPDMQGRYAVNLLDEILKKNNSDILSINRMGFDEAGLEEIYRKSGATSGHLNSMMYPDAIEENNQIADEVNQLLDEADAARGEESGSPARSESPPNGQHSPDPADSDDPAGPEPQLASNGQPIDELKARKQSWAGQSAEVNQVDYTLIIVCRTDEQKYALCRALEHPEDSAYIDIGKLALMCGLAVPGVNVDDGKPPEEA